MTAARARGSQRIQSNSERGKDRLEGLQTVRGGGLAHQSLLTWGMCTVMSIAHGSQDF